MLPIFALSPCNACGHQGQGTRAKGGSSVRCAGCRTMRRVPADRPTTGPDDQQASVPQRGRPFPPGHPWRFQASDDPPAPRTAPARRTLPKPPRAPRPTPRQAPQTARRPTPAAPVTPVTGTSFADLLRGFASRGRPAVPVPSRPRPDVPTTPARSRPPVRSMPRAVNRYPEFPQYRPCEQCREENRRGADQTYPPSVARISVYVEDKPCGDAYVCADHFEYFQGLAKTQQFTRVHILELPTGRTQPSGYVNPTVCIHQNERYVPETDVYFCPDCYNARPPYM